MFFKKDLIFVLLQKTWQLKTKLKTQQKKSKIQPKTQPEPQPKTKPENNLKDNQKPNHKPNKKKHTNKDQQTKTQTKTQIKDPPKNPIINQIKISDKKNPFKNLNITHEKPNQKLTKVKQNQLAFSAEFQWTSLRDAPWGGHCATSLLLFPVR